MRRVLYNIPQASPSPSADATRARTAHMNIHLVSTTAKVISCSSDCWKQQEKQVTWSEEDEDAARPRPLMDRRRQRRIVMLCDVVCERLSRNVNVFRDKLKRFSVIFTTPQAAVNSSVRKTTTPPSRGCDHMLLSGVRRCSHVLLSPLGSSHRRFRRVKDFYLL